MAELIALMETRFLVNYMSSRMQKMYADIKHKNELGHDFTLTFFLLYIN